jgi:hypothetical protein
MSGIGEKDRSSSVTTLCAASEVEEVTGDGEVTRLIEEDGSSYEVTTN